MYDENMLWLSQHWFPHLRWCWPFRRPQMRSEHYTFIWLQLPCDSGLGSVMCVEIRRSPACQEQIHCTQISIRSLAYWLFQAPCQCCLSHRCVWRETTYGTYVQSKHSATVQNSLAPLKACLHSCMYLLPCVNWWTKTHMVCTGFITSKTGDVLTWQKRGAYLFETRGGMNETCETWMEKLRCLLQDFLWHK
jgi:hypothetical protein